MEGWNQALSVLLEKTKKNLRYEPSRYSVDDKFSSGGSEIGHDSATRFFEENEGDLDDQIKEDDEDEEKEEKKVGIFKDNFLDRISSQQRRVVVNSSGGNGNRKKHGVKIENLKLGFKSLRKEFEQFRGKLEFEMKTNTNIILKKSNSLRSKFVHELQLLKEEHNQLTNGSKRKITQIVSSLQSEIDGKLKSFNFLENKIASISNKFKGEYIDDQFAELKKEIGKFQNMQRQNQQKLEGFKDFMNKKHFIISETQEEEFKNQKLVIDKIRIKLFKEVRKLGNDIENSIELKINNFNKEYNSGLQDKMKLFDMKKEDLMKYTEQRVTETIKAELTRSMTSKILQSEKNVQSEILRFQENTLSKNKNMEVRVEKKVSLLSDQLVGDVKELKDFQKQILKESVSEMEGKKKMAQTLNNLMNSLISNKEKVNGIDNALSKIKQMGFLSKEKFDEEMNKVTRMLERKEKQIGEFKKEVLGMNQQSNEKGKKLGLLKKQMSEKFQEVSKKLNTFEQRIGLIQRDGKKIQEEQLRTEKNDRQVLMKRISALEAQGKIKDQTIGQLKALLHKTTGEYSSSLLKINQRLAQLEKGTLIDTKLNSIVVGQAQARAAQKKRSSQLSSRIKKTKALVETVQTGFDSKLREIGEEMGLINNSNKESMKEILSKIDQNQTMISQIKKSKSAEVTKVGIETKQQVAKHAITMEKLVADLNSMSSRVSDLQLIPVKKEDDSSSVNKVYEDRFQEVEKKVKSTMSLKGAISVLEKTTDELKKELMNVKKKQTQLPKTTPVKDDIEIEKNRGETSRSLKEMKQDLTKVKVEMKQVSSLVKSTENTEKDVGTLKADVERLSEVTKNLANKEKSGKESMESFSKKIESKIESGLVLAAKKLELVEVKLQHIDSTQEILKDQLKKNTHRSDKMELTIEDLSKNQLKQMEQFEELLSGNTFVQDEGTSDFDTSIDNVVHSETTDDEDLDHFEEFPKETEAVFDEMENQVNKEIASDQKTKEDLSFIIQKIDVEDKINGDEESEEDNYVNESVNQSGEVEGDVLLDDNYSESNEDVTKEEAIDAKTKVGEKEKGKENLTKKNIPREKSVVDVQPVEDKIEQKKTNVLKIGNDIMSKTGMDDTDTSSAKAGDSEEQPKEKTELQPIIKKDNIDIKEKGKKKRVVQTPKGVESSTDAGTLLVEDDPEAQQSANEGIENGKIKESNVDEDNEIEVDDLDSDNVETKKENETLEKIEDDEAGEVDSKENDTSRSREDEKRKVSDEITTKTTSVKTFEKQTKEPVGSEATKKTKDRTESALKSGGSMKSEKVGNGTNVKIEQSRSEKKETIATKPFLGDDDQIKVVKNEEVVLEKEKNVDSLSPIKNDPNQSLLDDFKMEDIDSILSEDNDDDKADKKKMDDMDKLVDEAISDLSLDDEKMTEEAQKRETSRTNPVETKVPSEKEELGEKGLQVEKQESKIENVETSKKTENDEVVEDDEFEEFVEDNSFLDDFDDETFDEIDETSDFDGHESSKVGKFDPVGLDDGTGKKEIEKIGKETKEEGTGQDVSIVKSFNVSSVEKSFDNVANLEVGTELKTVEKDEETEETKIDYSFEEFDDEEFVTEIDGGVEEETKVTVRDSLDELDDDENELLSEVQQENIEFSDTELSDEEVGFEVTLM